MSKKIYALLVGINDYQGKVPKLNGCVNDVRHMLEFLKLRTEGGGFTLEPMVLTAGDTKKSHERKPTRDAIIEAFRRHLRQAGKDDVALFYYSGHGSQEQAPEAFWLLEPDHLNETIVCCDSRLPGNYDLADKELALLIHEVTTKNENDQPKAEAPHIVVIMDACHSGSGTRDPEDTGVRLAPTDRRPRPLDSYIVSPEAAKALGSSDNHLKNKNTADWFVPPVGRHVLLAACTAEESAKELKLDEHAEKRGVFSYHLLETLKRSGYGLTYRDLLTRVSQQVRNTVCRQTPQIESSVSQDQNATFLEGAVQPRPAYYQVNWSDVNQSWVLDAGAMHGIQGPIGQETTRLALFPFEGQQVKDQVNPFAGRQMSEAAGFATVTQVSAGQSLVALEQLKQPEDIEKTFYAVVVSSPMPPVQVAFEGDTTLLEAVRNELKRKDLGDDISFVVQETKDTNTATLRLIAAEGKYWIRRAADAYPLTIPADKASTAVARLAHVARWFYIANLENKTSQLPGNAIRVELHRVEIVEGKVVETPASGPEVTLTYQQRGNKWEQPKFRLTLHNDSEQTLHCAVLDLTEPFGISTAGLFANASVKLEPKAKVEATYNGSPYISSGIPKWIRQQGVDKLTDILKIIVSTDEINPALLEQDDLKDVRFRGAPRSADATAPKSTLGRLMRRVNMRGVAAEAGANEIISDWTTTAVRLVTLWPLDSVAIPVAGQSAQVGGVLSVQGHAGLQGKAQLRLKPFDAASRDASLPFTPSLLRDLPAGIQPFEFSPSRSAEPGHSAVELVLDNAADYEQVTPELPLMLRAGQALGPNESVLLVSYDRERGMYMPVGFGYPKDGTTEIQVRTLPEPAGTGERDVKGALLMLAYKLIPDMVKEKIGFEDPYPLLRVATVGEDGVTRYEARGAAYVHECVTKANHILLLVHGIIGDTRNIVASTAALYQRAPDLPKYDLILAFDYENINTRIQDTAVQLRERLEQVGLGAGHGKMLDLVAHSLGAEVCRWFIEREGGNQVASRLVMLGPPNEGTPLAVLQEWATHVIGLGLNGLLTLVNPASVVVNAVRFVSATIAGVEKVDTTLDQLKLNSDFYRDLNGSPDPQVPYFVVIGDTKQMKEAPAKTFFSSKAAHRILSLAFVLQPNDMAVSVKSAEAVALIKPDRNPLPKVSVIDCDHLTYFNTEAGLKALAEALKA